MAKDSLITLDFEMTDGSKKAVNFTVPGGRDGVDGLLTLQRETTMLKFDINQPDASQPNAAGRIGVGCYVRMRDFLPEDITKTNIHVQYDLLDIPMRGNNADCCSYHFNFLPPMLDEETGRVYCDVQLTTYYAISHVMAVGTKVYRQCYRPAGTSGWGSLISVSSKEEDWNCFRFYRTIMRL